MYTTDVSDRTVTHPRAGMGRMEPPHPAPLPAPPAIHTSRLNPGREREIDAGLFEADDELAQIPHGQKFPQPAINRTCAGLAWEERLAKRYAGVVTFHPGESDVRWGGRVTGWGASRWGWEPPAPHSTFMNSNSRGNPPTNSNT